MVAKASVHNQGSVQRFKFAGRLEFSVSKSVSQWIIQEFHQNVSQWIWIFNLFDWRKKSRKRTQRSGKPFLFKKGCHWRTHRWVCSFPSSSHASCFLRVFWVPNYFSFIRFDKFYDFPESTPFHNHQNAQETAQHYRFAPLLKTEASGIERRGEERTVVTCHVARHHLLRP